MLGQLRLFILVLTSSACRMSRNKRNSHKRGNGSKFFLPYVFFSFLWDVLQKYEDTGAAIPVAFNDGLSTQRSFAKVQIFAEHICK